MAETEASCLLGSLGLDVVAELLRLHVTCFGVALGPCLLAPLVGQLSPG